MDIIWFKDCSYENKNKVGGKNASLGELYNLSKNLNFKIANGFAITTDLYNTFIENNKYVIGAKCKLWDKKKDIIRCIKKYKQSKHYQELFADEMPINELYQIYCKSKRKFTVSKRYFENFVKEESELYIVENNFIKVQSFDNI